MTIKKLYIITLLLSITPFVQAQVNDPDYTITGEAETFTFGTSTNPFLSYEYTASEYIKFEGGFEYGPNGSNYFEAKIDPLMVFPPDAGTTGGHPDNDEGGVVGTVTGNFMVTPTGAAVYSIPIHIPTGTAGMSPELALVYNSQMGDGLLGEKWTLSGLSAISLAPKTFYYDGVSEAMELPQADGPFYLDGKRLLEVGSNAAITEYRTEIYNFTRIRRFNGMDMFMTSTKSGLTYQYGFTLNSRHYLKDNISGTKVPIAMYVNQISDKYGNYIEFEYYQDENDGEFRIKEIRYTGNSNTGMLPYNKIEFEYGEDRAEVIEALYKFNYGGGPSSPYLIAKTTKYLTGIKCITIGDALFREYDIQYEAAGVLGKKHINKVYEKISEEVFYNPTVFDWDAEQDGYSIGHVETYGSFKTDTPNLGIYPGDFNGDGNTDILNLWYDTDGNYKFRISYNTGSGNSFVSKAVRTLDAAPESITILDFNGDGFSDIVVEYSGPEFKYYKAKRFGEAPYLEGPFNIIPDVTYPANYFSKEINSGDFNGDGINDLLIVFRYPNNNWIYRCKFIIYWGVDSGLPSEKTEKNIELNTPNRFKIGDFDGDGKSEILVLAMSNNESFIYDIQDDEFVICNNSTSVATPNSKVEIGDFNGDRKSDVLYYTSSNTWKIYLGYGNDFVLANTITKENIYDDLVYPGDFNGDGRTDIMVSPDYASGGSWEGVKIFLAATDGKDFTEVNLTMPQTPLIHSGTKLIPSDFDGDGRTDFISSEGNINDPEYYFYPIFGNNPTMISSITNGLGDLFEILYGPITDNTVYSPVPPEYDPNVYGYPVSNIIAPIYVVKNMFQDNINGHKTTKYKYQAAMTHRLGKGFMGFMAFEQEDLNSNIKSKQFYFYDNPYFHLALGRTEVEWNGNSISCQINSTHYNVNPDNPFVFFPYVDNSYTETFELGTNSFVKSSKTKSIYDGYGNLTYMKTLNGGIDYPAPGIIPHDSYFEFSEEATNTYLPADEANWILGRLEIATVTSHIPIPNPNPNPPVEDIARSSEFEYYGNGMLWKETYEPDDPKSVTKEYFYDGYGNIIKSESSAIGMETRVIETNYDTDLPTAQRKGRFLTETINGLGHTENKIIDQVLAVVTETTGPNLFKTEFEYDSFGNLIITKAHNGIETTSVLRWVQTSDTDEPDGDIATFYSWDKQSGLPPAKTYFDDRGKPLRSVQTGFDGTKIYTDSYYNYDELLDEVTDPYFKGTPEAEILSTIFTYDELRRKETITLPGDRVTTINYLGLTVETSNPKTQTIKKTVNELSWTVKSYDATEQNYVEYNYYSNGQVRGKLVNGHPETEIIKYYDNFNNCTTLVDPALGTINYEYDAFGQLAQKTKNGEIIANGFVYDVLGRMTEKQEPLDDRTYNWDYDTGTNGIGRLASKETKTVSGTLLNKVSVIYDDFGRVKNEIEIINVIGQDDSFATSYTYDIFSRVKKLVYPSGFSISHKYNPSGYLGKIIRDTDKKTVWELTQMNARQQIKQTQLGNGLATNLVYYTNTGFIESINTAKTGTMVQDLAYGWDNIGNLDWRDKNTQQGNYLKEEFTYDNLNRLTQTDIDFPAGSATQFISYDELGRILHKKSTNTDFHVANNYTYVGDGDNNPYNLWKIDDEPAFYQGENQTVQYNKSGKIYHIDQTGKTLDIMYGLSHSRKTQTISDPTNNFEQTKVYVGGIYEKITENGQVKEVHYISSGDGLNAIYTENGNGPDQFTYTHKDHLGSVQALTNESGTLIEENSFDAWGLRRDPNTWIPYQETQQLLTDRGYTGHEHLDMFALINMNGRMYDPVVGLFTSPDPVNQFPGYTQGFNRYSYVMNNPLRFTDPSGNFIWAIAAFIITGGYDMLTNNWQGWEDSGKPAVMAGLMAVGGSGMVFNTANAAKYATSIVGNKFINETGISLNGQIPVGDGYLAFSLTPGIGFGMEGLFLGGGASLGYYDESTTVSLGFGFGNNQTSWGISGTRNGYGGGYYRTRYGNATGSNGKPNPQTVGGLVGYFPDGSVRFENDYFAGKHEDRWRSNAIEIQYKNFVLGTNLYNNDPKNEERKDKVEINGTDLRGNQNPTGKDGTEYSAWKNGQTYYSPIYVGYKTGNTIMRIGYSHKMVQDLTQNNVHRIFVRQHFYNKYDYFYEGMYNYSGYYNPYSLW